MNDAPLPEFLQDAIVALIVAVQDDERWPSNFQAHEAHVALVAAIRRTVAAAVAVARLEARRPACGEARVNSERVAYACRLPRGHQGDHHPNPCGHDGCTGLECLAAPERSETPAPEAGRPCVECKGRGWHPGDCHPRETCGVCDGSGFAPAAAPPTTPAPRCKACNDTGTVLDESWGVHRIRTCRDCAVPAAPSAEGTATP
jgi:hypothetical protein